MRALVALARERRVADDHEGARRLLEEAIDLRGRTLPTSAWRRANSHLAMVAAALGDPVEARQRADFALAGSDESVRTWTLAKRADAAAHFAAGDPVAAQAALTEVLDRLGDRPLAFLGSVREDLADMAIGT